MKKYQIKIGERVVYEMSFPQELSPDECYDQIWDNFHHEAWTDDSEEDKHAI